MCFISCSCEKEIPGSPCLHNFNVCVLECGSLGTELVWLCVTVSTVRFLKALLVSKPRYQVTYHTYLASRRRLSYTPSVKHVVSWTIRETQPVLQIFDYVMLTWKKIPGSPRFPVLEATKSWVGPGYKADTGGYSWTYTCSLNHIFRLAQLHQCDQEMLPSRLW